jgi:branched-chain amino acid aminotransferase
MLLHKFFIQDKELLPVEKHTANSGIEIYEVVRVINGVPLFFEDHLKRFYHSAWLLHLQIPLTETEVHSALIRLIKSNGIAEGNIRFSYCFRPCGRFQAFFIPHSYPTASMVASGVNCGLYQALRSDPNVKAVQAGIRQGADKLMAENVWYEVLLVNENGRISEGSRSNVFFVKDGALITAPDEEILPGITRKKVIELADESGIPLHYESLHKDNLSMMDAVFLTGTSPKVLPVRRVGDLLFSIDNPLVKKLVEGYNDLIDKYITNTISESEKIR